MKCSKCGAEIDGDSRYCEACGAKQLRGTKNKWWVTAAMACVTIGLLLGLLLPGRCSNESRVLQEEPVDTTPVEDVMDYGQAVNTNAENDVNGSQKGKHIKDENSVAKSENKIDDGIWVDLGLSVKWKQSNERGFYSYDEAVGRFSRSLPTMKQWKELTEKCDWIWTGLGYKVTGPNGNYITLPTAGYRICDGDVFDDLSGNYWTSTPDDSDDAWTLGFNSSYFGIGFNDRCQGLSVRLVRDR